jgi:hypothetical protein
VLLAAGLLGLLLLNTALAQNAFRMHALQQRSAVLAEQEQALSLQADKLSDPAALAAAAARLGLMPGGLPEYLPAGAPLPARARVVAREPDSGVLLVVVPPAATRTAVAGR